MDFFINHLFGIIDASFILAVSIAGYVSIKNIKRDAIITVQEKTIGAFQQQNEVMQSQIDSLKDKISDLEKNNSHQQFIIQTIQEALLKRGVLITIDGEMVTISDADGVHSMRKRPTTTQKQIAKQEIK